MTSTSVPPTRPLAFRSSPVPGASSPRSTSTEASSRSAARGGQGGPDGAGSRPPAEGSVHRLHVGSSRDRRASRYRDAIIRFVGDRSVQVATTHQVLERFWGLSGLSVSHGWRIVRQLVEDGWLLARPLDRSAGTTSRQLLSLTHKARAALAAGGWPPAPLREHGWLVEYRLQQTQMLIEREAEGWVLASADEVPVLLKQAAIAGWRGRRPLGIEEYWQRSVHSWKPTAVPLGALRHRSTGAVRLILPVRAGFDVRGTLRRLDRPSLAILSTGAPVGWELVGACPDDVDTAEERLRAWAGHRPRQRRRRPGVTVVPSRSGGELPVRIEVHRTAPYRDMPHPHRRGRRCVDVYAAHGVPHPLELR